QFPAPTKKVMVPSGSFTRRCISRYFCTKLARPSASSVSSPDETICFPSGPRISSIIFSSLLCAAATSALPASSADENVFWPCCCATERVGKELIKRIATTPNLGTLLQRILSRFSFICCIWLSPFLDFTIYPERNEPAITDARHRRHHEILRHRHPHGIRRPQSWRFRARNCPLPLR